MEPNVCAVCFSLLIVQFLLMLLRRFETRLFFPWGSAHSRIIGAGPKFELKCLMMDDLCNGSDGPRGGRRREQRTPVIICYDAGRGSRQQLIRTSEMNSNKPFDMIVSLCQCHAMPTKHKSNHLVARVANFTCPHTVLVSPAFLDLCFCAYCNCNCNCKLFYLFEHPRRRTPFLSTLDFW